MVRESSACRVTKKVISRLYMMACLTGLTVQVVTVSISYFKYETLTKLNIHVPYELSDPDVTMCVKFRDMRASNMTIKEILNSARNATTSPPLISKCMTRSNDSYAVNFMTAGGCLDQFHVSKSVYQEYVCYQISLRSPHPFHHLRKIVYSRKWSRMLLVFFFDADFMKSITLMKPLIHDRGVVPYITSSFGMAFEVRDPNYHTISLSYTTYQIQRLASPYGSMCRNYSSDSGNNDRIRTRESCIQECLMHRLQQETGLLPFTSFISDPLQRRQITMADIQNVTISQTVNRVESECEGRCSQVDCDVDFVIPHSESLLEQESKIIIFTPNSPDFLVHEEIAFRLVDYLIFIASCFGSWMGLSFLHLNPILVYEHLRQITAMITRRTRQQNKPATHFFSTHSHRKQHDLVTGMIISDHLLHSYDMNFPTASDYKSLFNSRRRQQTSPPRPCKEYCRNLVSSVDHKCRKEMNDLRMQINLLTISVNRSNHTDHQPG